MTLDNISAGDLVGIENNGGWRRSISGPFAVERTTKTKVVVNGNDFSRSGIKRGSANIRAARCVPWTDELAADQAHLKAEIEAERLCRNLSDKLACARGVEAIRLSAMISDDLKAEAGQ